MLTSTYWQAAASMLMLYAGKMSGILVNLVFIPIYTVSLGSEKFGLVAVILSLQALLMMLDLGLSTLVGRDIAANQLPSKKLFQEILCAESTLILFYTAVIIAFSALYFFDINFGLSLFNIWTIILTFLCLVIQNLHYNAIVSKRSYNLASALQLIGNLGRAGSTAYVLYFVSPTITAFILCQFFGAAIQAIIARMLLLKSFKFNKDIYYEFKKFDLIKEIKSLLLRSKSLALLTLAGAAVTQLDKPIISFFISHSSVAPYFLAMTYCMTPMAVLAAPVAQYFQPKIINTISETTQTNSLKTIKFYSISLSAVTLLPSIILYIYSDFFINIWLHHGPLVNDTKNYVKVLLPGLVIGALGYIPNSLLLATGHFRFMATISILMTVSVITLTIFAAKTQSILLICWIYALYHGLSTLFQYIKATRNIQTRIIALESGKIIASTLALSTISLIIFNKLHQ